MEGKGCTGAYLACLLEEEREEEEGGERERGGGGEEKISLCPPTHTRTWPPWLAGQFYLYPAAFEQAGRQKRGGRQGGAYGMRAGGLSNHSTPTRISGSPPTIYRAARLHLGAAAVPSYFAFLFYGHGQTNNVAGHRTPWCGGGGGGRRRQAATITARFWFLHTPLPFHTRATPPPAGADEAVGSGRAAHENSVGRGGVKQWEGRRGRRQERLPATPTPA